MSEQVKANIIEAIVTSYTEQKPEQVWTQNLPTAQEIKDLSSEIKMVLHLEDGLEIIGVKLAEAFCVQILKG